MNNKAVKAAVLTVVSGVALNALLYLAMNTGLGYNIVVFGCIGIVEIVLIYNFLKWMLGPFKSAARRTRNDLTPDEIQNESRAFLDSAYEHMNEMTERMKDEEEADDYPKED